MILCYHFGISAERSGDENRSKELRSKEVKIIFLTMAYDYDNDEDVNPPYPLDLQIK